MPVDTDLVFISRTPNGGFVAYGSAAGCDGAIFYRPAPVENLYEAIRQATLWAFEYDVPIIYMADDCAAKSDGFAE